MDIQKSKTRDLSTKSIGGEDSRKSQPLLILLIFILGFIIGIILLSDKLEIPERFTEFYLLDEKNQAGVPTIREIPNQNVKISYGIVNYEGNTGYYRIIIKSNDRELKRTDIFTLEDKKTKEGIIEFQLPPEKAQEINIFLEKQGSAFPYRSLQIIMDN